MSAPLPDLWAAIEAKDLRKLVELLPPLSEVAHIEHACVNRCGREISAPGDLCDECYEDIAYGDR